MKRIFVKILCAMLALTTVFSLASCGKKYDVICIADENGEIAAGFNENMLSFHMSMEKTTLLYQLGFTEDTPEIWNYTLGQMLGESVVEQYADKTFAQYNNDVALENAKRMVAASYLFDKMKNEDTVEGKVIKAEADKMDAQIDNVISQLQLTIGSKANFEAFISGAGITMDDLRKYYEMSHKTTALRSAVYVSEDAKKEYFSKNYAIVKHILINTESKTNEAGGKVSLTAEEKNAKMAEVRAIEARLAAGEDFETVYAEFDGTDPGTQYYTDGYFVTANNKYMPEFQDAALTMKDGETKTVYTSYGAHIMKKYPMDADKYNKYTDVANEITTVLSSAAYSDLLNPYIAKVTVNGETFAKYGMEFVSMLKPE